jgi:hypothetical protein
MSYHQKRWFWQAPVGLALIGFGLTLLSEAAAAKQKQSPGWFPLGTLALSVINSGISIFGDSVKHRVLHELAN